MQTGWLCWVHGDFSQDPTWWDRFATNSFFFFFLFYKKQPQLQARKKGGEKFEKRLDATSGEKGREEGLGRQEELVQVGFLLVKSFQYSIQAFFLQKIPCLKVISLDSVM